MEHGEEVIYHPYNPRTDFVQKKFYEAVIPILQETGKFPQNIIGTGFLFQHDKLSYIITAKHVLKGEQNPNILLTSKTGSQILLGTTTLEAFGVKWIFHPDRIDLVAIPLILPKSVDERIFNKHLIQGTILDPSSIRNGAVIKHIGYGGKMTGRNKKTKEILGIPGAAFGLYDSGTRKIIKVRSPAIGGDSGSPLFLKRGQGISLLGVIVKTSPVKKVDPQDGKYYGNTIAIPIHHLTKILNSKQMKKQVENGIKKMKEFNRII